MVPTIRIVLATLVLVTAAPFAQPSPAGEVVPTGVGGVFGVPVQSMKELRSLTVVRQQYDFSCGAAAVATLLSYHYGKPVGEAKVFKAMYAEGDQQKIKTQGFSMLDMKRYLDDQGFHADGFRLKLERLEKIAVPMITLINVSGYKHFVVIKGLTGDRVLVGDPAFGTSVMEREKFRRIWSGTVLAIRDQPRQARKQFNKPEEWRVRPKAPIDDSVDRTGLSAYTLQLPGHREF